MLDLLLNAVLLGAVAVVWAVVLVDTGMLLEPLQRWLRAVYQGRSFTIDTQNTPEAFNSTFTVRHLDDRWWFKAVWGCFWCVAGQLGFWVDLLTKMHWHGGIPCFWAYHPLHHAYFVSLAILSAGVWNRLYQWSRQY